MILHYYYDIINEKSDGMKKLLLMLLCFSFLQAEKLFRNEYTRAYCNNGLCQTC